ncbi:hypothetical protein [Chitinimonas naiadis]
MNIATELTTYTTSEREAASVPAPLTSAVSWAAIIAGAVVAAALSLMLLLLGMGLDLSTMSPWVRSSIGTRTIAWSTILWLMTSHMFAAACGGYITARLCCRWRGEDDDEIYFRDSAHGLLAWSLAALITAVLLTPSIESLLTPAGRAGSPAAVQAKPDIPADALPDTGRDMAYEVDLLFRRNTTVTRAYPQGPLKYPAEVPSPHLSAEVTRILLNALDSHGLPEGDIRYVGQVIAPYTGLPQAVAEQRVKDSFETIQAKLNMQTVTLQEALKRDQKNTANSMLWLFIAVLMGAFVACVAAIWGGQHRDH